MIKVETKQYRITAHKKLQTVIENRAKKEGLKTATYLRDFVVKYLRQEGENV